jgi:amino acid adenylation domain-containing protein
MKIICVHELLADQAAKSPNAAAVVAGDRTWTYRALDDRATQLARNLRLLGIQRDTVVGLCMKRSFAMVVGALGILKAGGAYLPIDWTYPAAHLSYVLNDAKIPVIVTQKCLAHDIPKGSYRIVALDEEGLTADLRSDNVAGVESSVARPISSEAKASNLAYVIYTSGSTGQPKGVEVQHDSLWNLVSWHMRQFELTSADRASQFSGVGFDAAVWELWPYLLAGASVHIPSSELTNDPKALRDWLVAQKITMSFLPTPMAERVMALNWPATTSLRFLLTGADTLRHYPSPQLPFKVVNNYGPTECTVVTTSGIVSVDNRPATLPPIGRPILNTQVYILDQSVKPLPVNTVGEIYIGGMGVARGYRNRPDLTAQRFIQSPFNGDRDARLYKSGDLGYFLPDGQIAFVGRNDEQVKIRGYRVEPNEVATALNEHPAIEESCVVAREFAPGDLRLVAYLVLSENARLTQSSVRDFIGRRLPQHMIPAVFVRLDTLPRNANGKIDRAALPNPNEAITLQDELSTAPRTRVEHTLTQIVGSLLQLELQRIGIDDNFFMLGGHSLLGIQLIARIRESFGVELPLRKLFDTATIENLALEIEKLLPSCLTANPELHDAERPGRTA